MLQTGRLHVPPPCSLCEDVPTGASLRHWHPRDGVLVHFAGGQSKGHLQAMTTRAYKHKNDELMNEKERIEVLWVCA